MSEGDKEFWNRLEGIAGDTPVDPITPPAARELIGADVEIVRDAAGPTWVLTDSGERAAEYCRQGKVGLTRDDMRQLWKFTKGEQAPDSMLDAVAKLKLAFPGASIEKAVRL